MEQWPVWLNLALFVLAAAAVYQAGVRLAVAADLLAERTGIGRALLGAVLLGGVTSLPEGSTTVAAAAIGSPALAVNNILGGVAMQVVVLALADSVLRRHPLSFEVAQPSVLLQAALCTLLLGITAAGLLLGDVNLFGLGAWTIAIFVCALLAFALLHQGRAREPWKPRRFPHVDSVAGRDAASLRTTRGLILGIGGLGLVILVAGIVLAQMADALAVQTGLGTGLIGALLLALATSLPELSTTISAIRLGQHTMAYSNIFGANILDLSLLLLADAAYRGGPVLNHTGTFALGMTLLAILLTTVALIGLLERRRLIIWRFGVDSLVMLLLYVGGFALLYRVAG
ncbi:hypothetical protein CAI21_14300 [Alkalilimnicola ehrlichii]|uniref:Sodium/calcium exchanger membrane region domain-containing protein n=1 Tax=Alkalilimnicola ehrlichii TaxID=351052 RepID=A0A3E0WNP1_9GAMM|nr:sodium:calcium antiporter [Alkalilimnicola ehrlichii]RFA27780.1 hypothetical protein CAI21_14300 [Alkalilimnicola ehrlichii]RFA33575.1 hypothetical protein CAL65_17125 [Alkalilimnicola ehrlichii]